MASFVIHTIIGERFLNKIENIYNFSLTDYDRKQFLLGNLIPDSLQISKEVPANIEGSQLLDFKIQLKSKIRKEKIITHFRNPDKEDECLKVPVPDLFLKKYNHLLKQHISVLGYLFHLYTDKLFFSKLFPDTFDNLDENGKLVTKDRNLVSIRIRKSNKIVNAKEFWAGTSKINIYNDYTIMNKLLLEQFGTSFNKDIFRSFAKDNFKNPGIEEVSFEKITQIIDDTNKYIEKSYSMKDHNLSVFDKDQVINFVDYVVNQFIIDYNNLIDDIFLIRKNTNRGDVMIFASNNQGKLNEIKSIFSEEKIVSLKEASIDVDVEENADSFYGNALKKAKEIYEIARTPVIADDSGLCIDAFDGWPGVLTHRFAGENANDEERNNLIIEKLKNITNKKAKVVCNLVYYDGENIIVGEGILKGTITNSRGSNGFGFDPIFELENGKTLAELSKEEKNLCSARYLAAKDLKNKLNNKDDIN